MPRRPITATDGTNEPAAVAGAEAEADNDAEAVADDVADAEAGVEAGVEAEGEEALDTEKPEAAAEGSLKGVRGVAALPEWRGTIHLLSSMS